MKTKLQKIFLLAVMFSLSVLAYAQLPEDHSILRFESKDKNGNVVYAMAKDDGSVVALPDTDKDFVLENSLWQVVVSGSTFTLKNLGTDQYLNYEEEGKWYEAKRVSLSTKASGVSIYADQTGYYIKHKATLSTNNLYIQYDPNKGIWMFYAKNGSNKGDSQGEGNWSDTTNPPSDEENSMEIPGTIVDEMFGGTNPDLDAIKNAVESGDLIDEYKKDPTPIVVKQKNTYPTGGVWKTATIKLQVNSADWTPVSFPVDVKCTYNNTNNAVGFQYFDSGKRANGGNGWVTSTNIAGMTFKRGVAYHFATDNSVAGAPTEIEFKPVAENTLTIVEDDFSTSLASTGGDNSLNANWYYIGNALFKNANMSKITKISRYNGSNWVEEPVSGTYDPFDAFFVQYSGDYAMSTSTTKTNAPMRDRKVVTEKYCLNIAGEDTEDKTYLYFEDGASAEGYVIGEDFMSFATIGGANTEIYTYAGDIDYSFNTRPIENTLVYVGLYIAKAGTYTISLDNISGNAETFVLYDNYEQDFVRLHLGETYTFYSERGEFNDRFGVAVTYAPEVPTDNISLEAVNLVVVGNEIQGVVEGADYAIYNSTGSLVYSDVAYAETVTLPDLTSGVYIVRTTTGWTKFVVK